MTTYTAYAKPTKLSEILAEKLGRDIRRSNLPPGSPYLTEAHIGRRHGMSRTIVREAISRLQAMGILESRQGSGLTVRQSDPVKMFAANLPFFDTTDDSLLHLAQFRYALEIGAVALAATDATPAQIDRLKKLADAHEQAFGEQNDPGRANQLDTDFHCLILDMTHNSLISSMQRVVIDYMAEVGHSVSPNEVNADRQHHAIVEAISRRDAEEARLFMAQHLEPLIHQTQSNREHG